ncbi:hypothetical protein N431DRAFT_429975 [Stipitochalara longipes BDJ]|nr:hypothetical protein N431DRAFT_429975 [Stipitochalara longipes BDJ]
MEFDSNNSPFIRLPAPHKDIIITPPRYSDGEAVIEILSDPRVYMNLAGPPYPYGQKEWDEWFPIIGKASKDALSEWREVEKFRKEGGDGKKWINGAPVTAIREVDPLTGEQKFIGTLDPTRNNYIFHGVHAENQRKQDLNDALKAGDPKIDWSLGYYLAPSHHGRGIMKAAIGTIMTEVLVPYMNAHLITVSYFDHNAASRKVLEKHGFVLDKIEPDYFELPESKTGVKGKKIGVGFMKWTRTS